MDMLTQIAIESALERITRQYKNQLNQTYPGELELFKELWPVLNEKETSPAGTEDSNAQLTTILPQSEPDDYADPNQIRLEI